MPLLSLLLVVAVALAAPDNNKVNKDECSERVSACSATQRFQQRRPVCGTDNLTYMNRCHLLRAQCQGVRVEVKGHGSCKDTQQCWTDLHYAQRIPRPPQVELFAPTCLEDGSYAPVQCHAETGYCWCVTPSGRPVPNTSVRHARPTCGRRGKSGTRRRSSPGARKHKKGCGRNERTAFNNNLIKNFRAEYIRQPNTHPSSNSETDRAVLDWKFASMDRNNDTFLSKPEYGDLRRLVRKVVKPRRCAKMFARLCDLDVDRRISREEWTACLGLDFNPNDCLSDRRSVLEEPKLGTSELYLPECTPDGRYKKIQCYNSTGYCWCVYEDTGNPIPGTSIKDQNPNCDVVPPPTRPMSGCPEPRKQMFLKAFLDFMKKKMVAARNKNSTESAGLPIAGGATWAPEEHVATWTFHSLDKNKNKLLERKEWKSFRQLVTSQHQLRRCGKRLPRYCDVNQDHKISLTEWLNCLSVYRSTAPLNFSSTPGSNRTGNNPLRMYLKHDE